MANHESKISISSRGIWIGLIVAITFGLAIEFLKSTRSSVEATASRSRFFGLLSDDDSVSTSIHRSGDRDGRTSENREKANRARSRLLRGRIAGLDTAPSKSETPPAVNVATVVGKTKDDAAKAAKAKKIADAKRKKKKKKKKKEADPAAVAAASPSNDTSDDSKKSKSSDDDFGGGSSVSGGGNQILRTTVARAGDLNENPQSLDEWVEFILREPSYERTLKLVEAQQTRSIDSEIFHEVVRQMLADSREKMHEFAIFALGSSPSLKSFLLLEHANRLQSEGSQLRLQSRTYLRAYSKLEHLRVLASVISTGTDARVSYEALKLIQIAVLTYRSRPSTPGAPSPGGPATSTTPPNVSRQFSPLVSVLTRFAQVAPDETLQQEASRTLQQVQTLVGTPTTAPAA